MPDDAFVAEVTDAVNARRIAQDGLTAKAIAEAFDPEVNESTCTPVRPEISSVMDVAMADALETAAMRSVPIANTLTTTGIVAPVPNAAVLIVTSCSALVCTPLVREPPATPSSKLQPREARRVADAGDRRNRRVHPAAGWPRSHRQTAPPVLAACYHQSLDGDQKV